MQFRNKDVDKKNKTKTEQTYLNQETFLLYSTATK